MFPCAENVFSGLVCPCVPEVPGNAAEINEFMRSFPALFSDKLGTAKGTVCHLELTDNVPVRSRPYQCSPPRLKILRGIVQDLLDKGVIRKSSSQYASPAFLVPKPHGDYRMVVDYRLLNKR
jgi:hypothetical protein